MKSLEAQVQILLFVKGLLLFEAALFFNSTQGDGMNVNTGQVYSSEEYEAMSVESKKHVVEVPDNLTRKAFEVLEDETNHYNTVQANTELDDWRVKNLKPVEYKRKKKTRNKMAKKSRKINRKV